MRTCRKSRLQTNWRYYNTSHVKIQYNPINSQIIQHLYVSENRFRDAFSHISLLFGYFPYTAVESDFISQRNFRPAHAAFLIAQNENAILVTHYSSHNFLHTFLSRIFVTHFSSHIFRHAPFGSTAGRHAPVFSAVCLVLCNTD